MTISALKPAREIPFSLAFRGTSWGNLFALPGDRGETAGRVTPHVLPESVLFETSADDVGGSLSFTVEQPVTPAEGPWFAEANLPDNAIVEFGQNKIVDPRNMGQTRLFVGYVDSINSRPNAGGAGTISDVTCVSTNAILDRIIVRKYLKGSKTRVRSRVTIPEMTDRAQIKKILELTGAVRSYGDLMVFNPKNHSEIATTTSTLPALELQIGSLRSALESVVEAAAQKDGKRRSFHVNPITGALVYGYADAADASPYPTAPWEIVADPAATNLATPSTIGARQQVLRYGPVGYWPLYDGVDATNIAPRQSAAKLTEIGSISTLTGPLVGEPNNRGATVNGTGYYQNSNWRYASALMSKFTFSTWVRRTGASAGGTIIKVLTDDRFGSADASWELGCPSNDSVLKVSKNGVATSLGYTLPANTWVHLGLTYDGTTVRLYVNGIQEATATISAPTKPAAWIGVVTAGGASGETNNFDMADLALFARQLLAVQVKNIYDSASWTRTPNRIAARDLNLDIDHSRTVKVAVFIAADSNTDLDDDPDPYVRRYDTLRKTPDAGGGLYFSLRNGPRFEAMVDAPTVRSNIKATRAEQLRNLAAAYFTARRAPDPGGSFIIRGTGTEAGQRYGFNGGWAQSSATDFIYVPGWRVNQFVKVVNPALGLNGTFRIEAVSMSFEPGGFVRVFTIEFQRRVRNKLARLIVTQ